MTLTEGQWAIDGLTFGRGTEFNLAKFEVGPPDGRENDFANPREDGDRFGRDYKGGRTISFELNAFGERYQVLDRLAELESAWDAAAVRAVPGATSILSYCRGGQTRRVYGRARRFAADSTLDWAGNVPVVCDFRTTDHQFYSDTETAETIGLIPEEVGGLVGPLIGPIISSGAGVGSRGISVGGTEPTWLVMRIDGPIINPTIEVVDQWSATLNLTLANDQWIVIDPTPWARTVRRNDGANMSGAFTATSRRLSGMRVPPGTHQVILGGTDPTATARMSMFWRSVWASY